MSRSSPEESRPDLRKLVVAVLEAAKYQIEVKASKGKVNPSRSNGEGSQ
jgi:hypothetical protein